MRENTPLSQFVTGSKQVVEYQKERKFVLAVVAYNRV
jgi:hypothetical protein